MKTAALIALALASHAHAEALYQLSDNMWVWSGGSATKLGNGWYGSGWDRFPGVSPPWNPIQPAPSAPAWPAAPISPWAPSTPSEFVVPMLEAPAFVPPPPVLIVLPPPPPPPLEFNIAGQILTAPRTW